MSKLTGVVVLSIITIVSILGLGFMVMHQIQLNKNVEEAQKNLDVANENLAQAYADMPWTLEHIIQDINSNVLSGEFDRATGDWLIQRVQEIRSQPTP
jgi:hypothetical protein